MPKNFKEFTTIEFVSFCKGHCKNKLIQIVTFTMNKNKKTKKYIFLANLVWRMQLINDY